MASTLYFGGDVMSREYERGFRDGWISAQQELQFSGFQEPWPKGWGHMERSEATHKAGIKERKRKLSKWQKFVKEKSKLPRFKYKTGKRRGMVNMKAIAAAWKKVPKSKK